MDRGKGGVTRNSVRHCRCPSRFYQRLEPSLGSFSGADDDGSETVTTMEVFCSFVGTEFRPIRPVELHWYSAEEADLLGSQVVAESYEKKGAEVIAMIQNDMTGYILHQEPRDELRAIRSLITARQQR